MANPAKAATATITGVDQGTDWLPVTAGRSFDAWVDVTGSGVATLTLQRRLTGGDGTVYDVKAYSVNDAPEIGYSVNNWDYRIYCKTGDYTSGSIGVGLWTT